MKKVAPLVLLLLYCLLCVSCKGAPPLPPPDPVYELDAIHLNLTADQNLNFFQGRPHHLSLCLYQLRDPNAFNQLTGDQEGLYKLLECDRFDPSVATSNRLDIMPGQELNQSLDRAEGAFYLGVAAGYYSLQRDHCIRFFDIPVVIEEKGWIRRTKTKRLGHLTVDLFLGPQELQVRGIEQ